MNNTFSKQNLIKESFLFIQLILWMLILFRSTSITRQLEFASVCIAALYAFLDYKKINLIKIAFLFIVLGDLFLTLLRPQMVELGLAFFICSSLVFACYIFINQKQSCKLVHLFTRIAFSATTGLIIGLLVPDVNATLILTGIYGINLILNVIFSFTLKKRNVLLVIGLICFMFCDIYVGLFVAKDMDIILYSGNPFIEFILGYTFNFAWFFYIPCLTLLSFASKKR